MLSQKAFNDYTWCPALTLEPEGHSKRLRADPTVDSTTESILRALHTFESDRRVLCHRISHNRYRIEPHGEDGDQKTLWIVANTPVTPVLVSAQYIDYVVNPSHVMVWRSLLKKPFGDQEAATETALRRVLWCSLNPFVSGRLTVYTTFPDCQYPYETSHVTYPEAFDTYRLVQEVYNAFGNDTYEPKPNYHHCPSCRWVECAYKKITKREFNPTGRVETGMF